MIYFLSALPKVEAAKDLRIVTSNRVSVEEETTVPLSFRMEQNYPNPFNERSEDGIDEKAHALKIEERRNIKGGKQLPPFFIHGGTIRYGLTSCARKNARATLPTLPVIDSTLPLLHHEVDLQNLVLQARAHHRQIFALQAFYVLVLRFRLKCRCFVHDLFLPS